MLESPETWIVALLLLAVAVRLRAESVSFNLAGECTKVVSELPPGYIGWLVSTLRRAGYRTNRSYAITASTKIALALLTTLTVLLVPPLVTLPVMFLSFFIPDLYVFIRCRRRQQSIRNALPKTIDLLVMCSDAGLGLDSALQKVISFQPKSGAELHEELQQLTHDIVLGMDRERAYKDLYDRTGVLELKTLGTMLHQSTTLGIGLSKVLRTQGEFVRKKLLQRVEERAHKIPVLMIFPLWFGIMPSVFLVTIAPSIMETLQFMTPMKGGL